MSDAPEREMRSLAVIGLGRVGLPLALTFARTARFAPLPGNRAQLTPGTLIFEWHTVPQTNSIPVPP